MSMAVRSVAKEHLFARAFSEVPDVLIQDPAADCAYFLKAEELLGYEAGEDTWLEVGPGTVFFVVPGEDVIEELPPFLQSEDEELSVLVQFPQGACAFFLSPDDLEAHRIEQPTAYWDGFEGISFVVPRGLELIEQLPSLRRARLQSGT